MDKGLIEIQEKNKKLEELNLKKEQNDSIVREQTIKYYRLEDEMLDLSKEIQELNTTKINFKNAPENRRKAKKKILKTNILAYVALLAVLTIICLTFPGGSVIILPSLGIVTLGALLAFSAIIPMEFNQINRIYPDGNILKINEKIEELSKQLTVVISNKYKAGFKLEESKELRKSLEIQIQDLLQEISSIESLRTKVINDFCSNNPVLDEKINKEYDEDVRAKEKVKINK